MKFRITTTVALILMTATILNAQTGRDLNLNIGAKIGLNSSTINSDRNAGYDLKPGLHLGLLGHLHINKEFAVQPEVLFSMQGARIGNTDINLNYMKFPIMFQYMFDNGFRFQAGPQVGVLINAKMDKDGESTNIIDEFKRVDAGFGMGASYVHAPSSFGIDIRYNFGLIDIAENFNVNSTNRVLQVGVFYLFNHK